MGFLGPQFRKDLGYPHRCEKSLQEAPGAFIYEIPAQTTSKNTVERFTEGNVSRYSNDPRVRVRSEKAWLAPKPMT